MDNIKLIQDNPLVKRLFDGHEVAVVAENGKMWFNASDVSKVLGSGGANLQDFDEHEKQTIEDVLFVSTHGVFRLIFQSEEPNAEEFRKRASDVLDAVIKW